MNFYLTSCAPRGISEASYCSPHPSPSHPLACLLALKPASSPYSPMANLQMPLETGEPGQHL